MTASTDKRPCSGTVASAALGLLLIIAGLLGALYTRVSPRQNTLLYLQSSASFALPRNRVEIGSLLEAHNLTTGVELGVKQGEFALETLKQWPSCAKYYLVDIWQHQENYSDGANVRQEQQELFLAETRARLRRYGSKVVLIRNFTRDAVRYINGSVDYVYVDARHDYCGVQEDLVLYWPKIRSGGVMAGHDYMNASQVRALDRSQDWSLCGDGSVQPGAVRGAVDEFFGGLGLTVHLTYQDAPWDSWLVFKP